MRQIAECLQIKAPSLYHHFPSTETLAQQSFGHYRQDQTARLRVMDALDDLTARLNAYAALFAEMPGDGTRPCLYLVMMREPAFQDSGGAAELKRCVDQTIDWLEQTLPMVRGKRDRTRACPSAIWPSRSLPPLKA